MASSSPSGPREVGERAATPTRRHLLTTPGSQSPAPRVVLHLPDLDALSAITLGPSQPAARRRIDAAHSTAPVEAHESPAPATSGGDERHVVHGPQALRGPIGGRSPQTLENALQLITKTIVLLQQPRMALAAVVAIGLQLAAVLAMLTGSGGDASNNSAIEPQQPNPHVATVELPPPGAHDPIRTPLTVFGGHHNAAPPQTLPDFGSSELPAWPTDAGLADGGANQPAKLPALEPRKPASPGPLPTLAPSRDASPAAVSNNGPLPTLPVLPGSPAAGSTKAAEVVHTKPKARLQGTIKKISTGETNP